MPAPNSERASVANAEIPNTIRDDFDPRENNSHINELSLKYSNERSPAQIDRASVSRQSSELVDLCILPQIAITDTFAAEATTSQIENASKILKSSDGGTVEIRSNNDRIMRNADNEITEIKYNNGNIASNFHYNKDHELTGFDMTGKDGKLHCYAADGGVITIDKGTPEERTVKGLLHVDKSGDLKVTETGDGTPAQFKETEFKLSGSQIESNQFGVTRVINWRGKESTYEYDAAGELTEVNDWGRHLHRDANGNWLNADSSPSKEKPVLDKDGGITYYNKDGTYIHHTAGGTLTDGPGVPGPRSPEPPTPRTPEPPENPKPPEPPKSPEPPEHPSPEKPGDLMDPHAHYTVTPEAKEALNGSPHPLVHLHLEHTLKGNPDAAATKESLKDMKKMLALAEAYKATGSDVYASKAKEYILSWARTNKSEGSSINDGFLQPLIQSYALLKDSPAFKNDLQADHDLRGYFKSIVDAQLSAQDKANFLVNNHYAHRVEILADIGFATGDKTLIDKSIKMFKVHIDHNMNHDGSTFDFHQRDALHYQQEDLVPLLRMAEVAQRNGYEDLFNYTNKVGGSLRNSVEFELPYITGEKHHKEFVNTTVQHDRDRAAAGDPEYAPHWWQPKKAKEVLILAELLDPKYHDYLKYT